MATFLSKAFFMTHYSYDSCGDVRCYERARVLESVSSASSRAVSIATNIAAHGRDIERLASYPSAYAPDEMLEALDAIEEETSRIREWIAKGKAAVREMEQSEEMMRGL